MREGFLSATSPVPLLITPEGHKGAVADPMSLITWLQDHPAWIEEKLIAYGGILFRGFGFDSPESFEQFTSSIAPGGMEYTRGASPRKHVSGKVYTSTEAPAFVPIPLHCEMSYVSRFPSKIFFYCHVPSKSGGQTPLADMQKVYDHLEPAVCSRFEAHGLRFIQNVPERRQWLAPQTWKTMFATDERAVVEAACKDLHIAFHWKPDGTLQLISERPAVMRHPKTGQTIWFNSAHNFHDSWSWEFSHLKRSVLAMLLRRRERRHQRTLCPEDYPNHCVFGDGSEIPAEDIAYIRGVLWQHAVLFDWQQGDVLVLDNLRIAHGRMPFRGARKVYVTLGEPTQ